MASILFRSIAFKSTSGRLHLPNWRAKRFSVPEGIVVYRPARRRPASKGVQCAVTARHYDKVGVAGVSIERFGGRVAGRRGGTRRRVRRKPVSRPSRCRRGGRGAQPEDVLCSRTIRMRLKRGPTPRRS